MREEEVDGGGVEVQDRGVPGDGEEEVSRWFWNEAQGSCDSDRINWLRKDRVLLHAGVPDFAALVDEVRHVDGSGDLVVVSARGMLFSRTTTVSIDLPEPKSGFAKKPMGLIGPCAAHSDAL